MGSVVRYRPPIYYLYALVFPNGKFYIGLTNNLIRRWRGHLKVAASGERNYPVYRALRKYAGLVEFVHLYTGTKDEVATQEIWAIATFKTMDRRFGYNLTRGGDIIAGPEISKKISRGRKKMLAKNPEYVAQLIAQLNSPEAYARKCEVQARPEVSAKKSAKLIGLAKRPETIEKLRITNGRPESVELFRQITKANWERSEYRAKVIEGYRLYHSSNPERTPAQKEALIRNRSKILPKHSALTKWRMSLSHFIFRLRQRNQVGCRIPLSHPARDFGPGSSAGLLF